MKRQQVAKFGLMMMTPVLMAGLAWSGETPAVPVSGNVAPPAPQASVSAPMSTINLKLNDTAHVDSELALFSNLKASDQIVVRWDNTLNISLAKYVTAGINLQMLYDKTVSERDGSGFEFHHALEEEDGVSMERALAVA